MLLVKYKAFFVIKKVDANFLGQEAFVFPNLAQPTSICNIVSATETKSKSKSKSEIEIECESGIEVKVKVRVKVKVKAVRYKKNGVKFFTLLKI